ncbi:hypothetical protein A3G53_02590 [Candidatus Nomurabacteria bacterium RIFCSPLOWO2_12_FULL_44_11]|uniref:EamA domain-containing protein n=1 Tax=Candidatus Nomurabacteria bacterium RIFCSPLOWO2_12_FULL_44_11 TaxID=1801796 RepID=A0A1F6Y3C0_9BACT|nr:MAG: hypothetical protein A3E95_01060 [Candidatus Nomurabacteria bacterium RIFCSPHIGHO2_12_FULL_44_22b]OGJ00881.1 MAG: hypothetical protein A3G53_02590 [Candidatus Nomurabacteria bacterium RIFCSPLOWO2_12_FULL_44_11]
MKEKWEEYKIIFLVIVMAVTGATTALFKIGLRELPIDLFTFIRFAFALLVLLPYLWTHKSEPIPRKQKLILISAIGAANVFLFVWGLEYTTAIISGMLYASVPLITAALASLILSEKVSIKKWLGIIVGFSGVLIIILGPTLRGSSEWGGTIFGNAIIFLAVIAFCFYSVVSKKYSSEYSPIVLVKYFFFTTFIVQSAFLLFRLENFRILADIHPVTWLAVIYSGVIGTTLYYFLYQYVIKKASPVLASTAFFLQPLANILWAWLLIGEKITSIFFFGAIFIFLGMAMVFHEQYSKPKVNN